MFNSSTPEATIIQEDKFVIKNTKDMNLAVNEVCKLAQFDSRYSRIPFTDVYSEILACVTANQFAIIAMPFRNDKNEYLETPVGYVLWGAFSPLTLAVYAKAIRNLSPIEYRSGPDRWVVQFGTPFGMQDEILNYVKLKLPELFRDDKLLAIDILEKIPYLRDNNKQK
jgi:hemolysin-activating ACP:hemolysin acyltransferase